MLFDKNFVKGKKVFLRVDFNVPIKNSVVGDDKKIRAVMPTIIEILKYADQVIIGSHLGRPNGSVVKKYSLKPVKNRLSYLLKLPVGFATNYDSLPNTKIVMLENLRFYKGEKKDDKRFAKKLAKLADVYINDAFGVSHRAHASLHAIAKLLPSRCGLLMKKEIDSLDLKKAKKPRVAILGFAKISDKTKIIQGLLDNVDLAIIGGAVVFTFLKAQGYPVGRSLVEPGQVKLAKKLLRKYGPHLLLAVDFETHKHEIVPYTGIKKNDRCLDIGPASIELFKGAIKNARTVIWNGPMGLFEQGFMKGSLGLAEFLASQKKIKTIIGGGDTAAMIKKLRLDDKMNHISTGGGASLELLAGNKLPGIEVLNP